MQELINYSLQNTFRINEHISLKLTDGGTVIFVDNNIFRSCKYLLIDIPKDKIKDYDSINSIDELIKNTEERDHTDRKDEIDPKTEFWGHCSNLQAWVENGYDIRILHSVLSLGIIGRILNNLSQNKDEYLKFFTEVVEALDDDFKATYGSLNLDQYYDKGTNKRNNKKFIREVNRAFIRYGFMLVGFRYDIFPPEMIQSSKLLTFFNPRHLSNLYDKREKIRIEKRKKRFAYHEAKIWGTGKENLEHRRLLRRIRDGTEPVISSGFDYLPYHYAVGRFIKTGPISFMYLEKSIIIRDEVGLYHVFSRSNKMWD